MTLFNKSLYQIYLILMKNLKSLKLNIFKSMSFVEKFEQEIKKSSKPLTEAYNYGTCFSLVIPKNKNELEIITPIFYCKDYFNEIFYYYKIFLESKKVKFEHSFGIYGFKIDDENLKLFEKSLNNKKYFNLFIGNSPKDKIDSYSKSRNYYKYHEYLKNNLIITLIKEMIKYINIKFDIKHDYKSIQYIEFEDKYNGIIIPLDFVFFSNRIYLFSFLTSYIRLLIENPAITELLYNDLRKKNNICIIERLIKILKNNKESIVKNTDSSRFLKSEFINYFHFLFLNNYNINILTNKKYQKHKTFDFLNINSVHNYLGFNSTLQNIDYELKTKVF